MNIILASASPRRKELLSLIYDDFLIIPANIDEDISNINNPEKTAEVLAKQKAEYIGQSHNNDIVIGCDTTVIINNEILGKPKDNQDSIHMLQRLSGNIHKVITGVAICLDGKTTSFSQLTEVEFYKLSNAEIIGYTETGEPFDKAGSYGIQGKGGLFVKKINGDYFNVVGLPIARLEREIKKILV